MIAFPLPLSSNAFYQQIMQEMFSWIYFHFNKVYGRQRVFSLLKIVCASWNLHWYVLQIGMFHIMSTWKYSKRPIGHIVHIRNISFDKQAWAKLCWYKKNVISDLRENSLSSSSSLWFESKWIVIIHMFYHYYSWKGKSINSHNILD